MPEKTLLRELWDKFLISFNSSVSQQTEEIERAIGFQRLREQLWDALDDSDQVAENGWAYPIDIYVDDEGGGLFSVVTQGGKLFRVPMSVVDDTVTLGAWVQVTEVFEPVAQAKNTFRITRQKDGQYRWLFVAATSVINRVGEIDSVTLFDSFIQHAADTNEYPRVDFYHLGAVDPETWEFGTADYLARDESCYIATGLFDEDHPLARAAIKAYEEQPGVWGCSIEFYAFAEPEIIVMDPEVRVPVYKSGKNTRISIVKECDAAGLFTRVANVTEEKVRMKRDILKILEEFFGDDKEAMEQFAENVDGINRTIKTEGLISRAKKVKRDPTPDEEDEEEADEEEEDDGEEDQDDAPIELDDDAIAQVAKVVVASPEFVVIQQSLDKLQAALDLIVQTQQTAAKDIVSLKKDNSTLAKRVSAVSKDDNERLQTLAEDLPSRRHRKATWRPRDQHDTEDEEDSEDEDMAVRAKQTLSKLPSYG